jgi:hypothetical protein
VQQRRHLPSTSTPDDSDHLTCFTLLHRCWPPDFVDWQVAQLLDELLQRDAGLFLGQVGIVLCEVGTTFSSSNKACGTTCALYL